MLHPLDIDLKEIRVCFIPGPYNLENWYTSSLGHITSKNTVYFIPRPYNLKNRVCFIPRPYSSKNKVCFVPRPFITQKTKYASSLGHITEKNRVFFIPRPYNINIQIGKHILPLPNTFCHIEAGPRAVCFLLPFLARGL